MVMRRNLDQHHPLTPSSIEEENLESESASFVKEGAKLWWTAANCPGGGGVSAMPLHQPRYRQLGPAPLDLSLFQSCVCPKPFKGQTGLGHPVHAFSAPFGAQDIRVRV
jgi:hypothetical protein